MQTVRALPRGSGDYVHPEENVQILDEATGETFDLIVKSEAVHSGERGSVEIFFPVDLVQDVIWENGFCIVKLLKLTDALEASQRAENVQRKLSMKNPR